MTAPTTTTTPTAAASMLPVTVFLRRALRVDAAVSGAAGILLTAATGPLAGVLGLPDLLLRTAGIVCLAWAVALWLAPARPRLPSTVVRAIVAGNALWVAASLVLLVSGLVAPTAAGVAFVLAQAVLVAGFTIAQAVALRRGRAPLDASA